MSTHDADTFDNVVAWLKQVRKLDELIDAKLQERAKLMDLATVVTPNMDGMPHGTNVSDKVGNLAVKLADLAAEINSAVDCYVDYKNAVVAELEKLPAMEYSVLHKRYIQYKTIKEIASDLGYSEVHIWRFQHTGIEHLKDVVECYDTSVI